MGRRRSSRHPFSSMASYLQRDAVLSSTRNGTDETMNPSGRSDHLRARLAEWKERTPSDEELATLPEPLRKLFRDAFAVDRELRDRTDSVRRLNEELRPSEASRRLGTTENRLSRTKASDLSSVCERLKAMDAWLAMQKKAEAKAKRIQDRIDHEQEHIAQAMQAAEELALQIEHELVAYGVLATGEPAGHRPNAHETSPSAPPARK